MAQEITVRHHHVPSSMSLEDHGLCGPSQPMLQDSLKHRLKLQHTGLLTWTFCLREGQTSDKSSSRLGEKQVVFQTPRVKYVWFPFCLPLLEGPPQTWGTPLSSFFSSAHESPRQGVGHLVLGLYGEVLQGESFCHLSISHYHSPEEPKPPGERPTLTTKITGPSALGPPGKEGVWI